jgi:hypothetical protein
MTRLFIHVGFPKTASSTLQRHLFARHSDVSYLGKPFSDPMARVEEAMLTLDEAAFEREKPELQRRVREEIAKAPAGRMVLSHEGFLRSTRYGHHDVRRTARRIHDIFAAALGADGELRILICLRRQPDLLLSHYAHFVRGNQEAFDSYVDAVLETPREGFAASLFYDELLTCYAEIFGEDKLEILLFEDLVADRDRFLGELSRILDIDAAESLSLLEGKHEKQKAKVSDAYLVRPKKRGRRAPWRRLLESLRTAIRPKRESDAGSLVALRPEQEARLADLYRAGNSRLAERFAVPLGDHGYATGR